VVLGSGGGGLVYQYRHNTHQNKWMPPSTKAGSLKMIVGWENKTEKWKPRIYAPQDSDASSVRTPKDKNLPKKPNSPTKAEICVGIKTLSRNMRHKFKPLVYMSLLKDQQLNPVARQTLPSYIEPITLYPAKTDFRKSHHNKVFIVHPPVPQIILSVLKSGCLDQASIDNIRQLNIKYELCLVAGWIVICWIDFRALLYPNFDWDTKQVNTNKMFLRMAAFFHFDLNVSSLQWCCGWQATGGHHHRQDKLL
jgi:hypothetical protein